MKKPPQHEPKTHTETGPTMGASTDNVLVYKILDRVFGVRSELRQHRSGKRQRIPRLQARLRCLQLASPFPGLPFPVERPIKRTVIAGRPAGRSRDRLGRMHHHASASGTCLLQFP